MADTIYVLGEGGGIWPMDLPLPEAIAQRLERGHLRRVNPDGSPYAEVPTGPADSVDVPAAPAERPADSAGKAKWVGWAVAQGASPEDADGMTKTDLIERFG